VNISYIIAYRESDEYRKRNLEYTLRWLCEGIYDTPAGLSHRIEVIVSQYRGNEDFNKCRCYNKGMEESDPRTDTFIFGDVDMTMDFEALIKAAELPFEAISPHKDFVNDLEPGFTPESISAIMGTPRWTPFAAGIIIIRKAAFAKIGLWNELFQGWGCEDDEMSVRIKKCLTYTTIYNDIFHLWHPPKNNKEVYHRNLMIYGREKLALHDYRPEELIHA
jgi:hypothetical protein